MLDLKRPDSTSRFIKRSHVQKDNFWTLVHNNLCIFCTGVHQQLYYRPVSWPQQHLDHLPHGQVGLPKIRLKFSLKIQQQKINSSATKCLGEKYGTSLHFPQNHFFASGLLLKTKLHIKPDTQLPYTVSSRI